jgi:hypothetical protein
MSEGLLDAIIELLPYEPGEVAFVVFAILAVALVVTVLITVFKWAAAKFGWNVDGAAGYINVALNVLAQVAVAAELVLGKLGYVGLDEYVSNPTVFVVVLVGLIGPLAGLPGAGLSKLFHEFFKLIEIEVGPKAAG